MRKINLCWLLIGGFAFLLSSCLGGDDSKFDEWNFGNAQISSFSLSNDSIKGLSSVVFTIDQLNGKIFNKDSMPYGTAINEKVLCTIKAEYSYSAIFIVQTATSDSSYWNGSDSIDFSAPVNFTVYAVNGITTKKYEAKINVHQVNPDSMVWDKTELLPGHVLNDMKVVPFGGDYFLYSFEGSSFNLYKSAVSDLNNWSGQELYEFPEKANISQMVEYENSLYVSDTEGKLYVSADGLSWKQMSNAPVISTLLGSVPFSTTNQASALSAIAQFGDTLRFVCMNKDLVWVEGDVVSQKFPISGFGSINYEAGYYPRLVVAGGRDSRNELSNIAWSTMDGLAWVQITNPNASFTAREGAAISYYDGCFYLVGGFDASGAAIKDIYYSKDQGVSWSDNAKVSLPDTYTARGGSSVIVNSDNFMLLFGGKASKNTNIELGELWSGRINRLGFKDE